MKAGGFIFGVLTLFFWILALTYGILSREWAGTTALALSGGLTFMISFYTLYTDRRREFSPEDDPEAEVSDGAGELGFFSPHSWWPLAMAGSAALLTVGIVLAWWIFALGLALLLGSIFGLVFEYWTEEHQQEQEA